MIAAGDVDALFEPFRRGGRVRTATRGAGLGLAIVRLIVDAHHGKLQAAAPPFGGLAIRIELPRATPPRTAVRSRRRAAEPAQSSPDAALTSPSARMPAVRERGRQGSAVSSICQGRAPELGEPGGAPARRRSAAAAAHARRRTTSEASRFWASTVVRSATLGDHARQRPAGRPPPGRGRASATAAGSRRRRRR